ncbi:MAG: hypothetical protein CMD31_04640 [Flavobacteriales bacterium]|nr:hypothetical protein [Flavobacteriales bacterium]|tara:strand:- start:64 stop:453 length:390 start_codon:yes stop_codon:yes gene_type:complete
MNNNEIIYSFLRSNGFRLVDKDISMSFGDYYDILTNDSFELRFSSSKSFETVDIRSSQLNENWYDLALVKALLYNEKKLNNITTIEEHGIFLRRELVNIVELFDGKNYLITKKKLEELGNERVKQMFPS